jgi:ElaB/YqjD/DUF883 family membrane-anchored ribosome-binding protein
VGWSLTGADYLKLAEAFLEEANCDLKVVDILIKATNPGLWKYAEQSLTEDEIFCVGRRTLFLLQQATEKLAKVFISAYPKPLLENMGRIVKKYSGIDLPKLKFARELLGISGEEEGDIQEKEKGHEYKQKKTEQSLLDQLEPKRMGHKPYEVIVELLRKYINTLTTYREPIVNSFNRLLKDFEELFNTLGKHYPEEKDRIKELKEVFLNELYKPLVKQFEVLNFTDKYLSAKHAKWRDKKEPPCLDILEKLKLFRSEVERLLQESAKKFQEAREKLMQYRELLFSLVKKPEMKDEDKKLAEYFLRVLYGEEGERALCSFFASSVYLSAFVVELLPCLVFYVSGGRYPSFSRDSGKEVLVNELRNEIMSDIKRITELREELDFLLREMEKAVKSSPAFTTLPKI